MQNRNPNAKRKPRPKIIQADVQAPYSFEAEEALLGALITNPGKFAIANGIIQTPKAFFMMRHVLIWEAIGTVIERDGTVDYVTLCKQLSVMKNASGDKTVLELIGGPAKITELITAAPSSEHVEIYAKLVNSGYIRRELIMMADRVKDLARNEELTLNHILADADQQMIAIKGQVSDRDKNYAPSEFVEQIGLSITNPRPEDRALKAGITPGFRDLAKLIGLFFNQEVAYICGPPKFGKTTCALSMAVNQTLAGHRIAYIPLEMTKKQLTFQFISMLTGIPVLRIKMGRLRQDELERVSEAVRKIYEWELLIVDDFRFVKPSQVKMVLDQVTAKYGKLDGLWIDGLYRVHSDIPKRERRDEIALITEQFAGFAHDYDMPVMVLHQFNREPEQRAQKRNGGLEKSRPRMTDISDSSAVDKDANLILGLWRESRFSSDEDASDDVEIHVIANRQGKYGYCTVAFEEERSRYVDLKYDSVNLGGRND